MFMKRNQRYKVGDPVLYVDIEDHYRTTKSTTIYTLKSQIWTFYRKDTCTYF